MAFPFEPVIKNNRLWSTTSANISKSRFNFKHLISPVKLALSTWNRRVRKTNHGKFLLEGLEPRCLHNRWQQNFSTVGKTE
jgi:hypothetical protein